MVEGIEEKSKITTIPHKYKDTLINFINSSDIDSSNWLETPELLDSPNWPALINNTSHIAYRSKSSLSTQDKENCLDKDVLVMLLDLVFKIQDS